MDGHAPCCSTFSHHDFDPGQDGCPIRGCKAELATAPFRGKDLPWCPRHGLRLHGKPGGRRTYAYLNGPGGERDSVIRNFPIEREFLEQHPLHDLDKAETHRLGYENAEDAVTWNVFAGLLSAGALGRAAAELVGRPVQGEPELWLWGHHVDLRRGFGKALFPPLARLRARLEPDVHPFATEPDVMLVVPGRMLILIEAKFTSGNSLSVDKPASRNEKPKDLNGLLAKYLPQGSDPGVIVPAEIRRPFHGQLFRNIVFAQAMAREAEVAASDWAVVNLICERQWKLTAKASSKGAAVDPGVSFADPSLAVGAWLKEEDRARFQFSSWEKLHGSVIKGTPELRAVDTYLQGKSAHLGQAFDLA